MAFHATAGEKEEHVSDQCKQGSHRQVGHERGGASQRKESASQNMPTSHSETGTTIDININVITSGSDERDDLVSPSSTYHE